MALRETDDAPGRKLRASTTVRLEPELADRWRDAAAALDISQGALLRLALLHYLNLLNLRAARQERRTLERSRPARKGGRKGRG